LPHFEFLVPVGLRYLWNGGIQILQICGTLNSLEWKTREWKSWYNNAWVEIAGVDFSAPNIRAGKRGSGNLGRRKSRESEAIIIADCID